MADRDLRARIADEAGRVLGLAGTGAARDVDVRPLAGGAGNPTSVGLYRVSTTSGHGGALHSAVLKIVRSPTELGDTWDGPEHPVYWRRELEAFHSPLLDRLPDEVAAPGFLGGADMGDGTAWLWLEDLGPMGRDHWTPPELATAARGLGRMHAHYLTADRLPDEPWLARRFARGWRDLLVPQIRDSLGLGAAAQPRFAELSGSRATPEVASLVRLLDQSDALVEMLEDLPVTLCHHDPNIDNLLLRTRPDGRDQLVLIDWQLVGLGPVGEDLGQLLSIVLAATRPSQRAEVEARLLSAYCGAMGEAGVELEPADVGRAYVAAAALRQSTFALFLLALEVEACGEDRDALTDALGRFTSSMSSSHVPWLASRALSGSR